MDPVSQGLLGAAAGYAIAHQKLGRGAALIGACAGMAPDLDILISSSTDPSVGWVFHRHFTHSIFFVPLGALVTLTLFSALKTFRSEPRALFCAAFAGMLTHALLDILTSYGTLWFWPFSMQRIALDTIAVIDPIYTLTLLVFVLSALWIRRVRLVHAGLLLSSAYLLFGGVQHHVAVNAQSSLMQLRGHQAEKRRVMPLIGSLVLWRSIYQVDKKIFIDGVRVPWFGDARYASGGSVPIAAIPAGADMSTKELLRGSPVQVLAWFADGWVGPVDGYPQALGDYRYGFEPNASIPLWGLKEGRAWAPRTQPDISRVWALITKGDGSYLPLPPSASDSPTQN